MAYKQDTIAFVAYLSSSLTNQTGDGTAVNLPFDATSVNDGGYFDTTAHTFTAPVAGAYLFNTNLYVQNLGAADTIGFAQFDINTGALDYIFIDSNFANMRDANNNFAVNAGQIIHLAAGDVVVVQCAVIGGAKTVGFAGGAVASGTNFSGYFIG